MAALSGKAGGTLSSACPVVCALRLEGSPGPPMIIRSTQTPTGRMNRKMTSEHSSRARGKPKIGDDRNAILDSGSRAVARVRHGLFRCSALAAALYAAHRSKYSGVVFPRPE